MNILKSDVQEVDRIKNKALRIIFVQRVRHLKHLSAFFFSFNLRKYRLLSWLQNTWRMYDGLIDPRIHHIYFRSFISNSFSVEQKLTVLLYHNWFLKERFREEALQRLFDEGILCYSEQIPSGNVEIVLKASRPLNYKEGALSVVISLNQKNVYIMSFTFAPDTKANSSNSILIISRAQMYSYHFDEVRKVTREMNDTSPEKLLLFTIEGIAQALNIPELVGIKTKDHVLYVKISDKASFHKRYSGFWEQIPGHQEEPIGYRIRLPLQGKQLNEIAQNHRSRTRAKRKKLKQLSASVCAALVPYLLQGQVENNGQGSPFRGVFDGAKALVINLF